MNFFSKILKTEGENLYIFFLKADLKKLAIKKRDTKGKTTKKQVQRYRFTLVFSLFIFFVVFLFVLTPGNHPTLSQCGKEGLVLY